MCGIVGFISKNEVAKDIVKGLQAIEYRGYDSAGIAFQGGFEVFKSIQNLDLLETMVSNSKQKIGIGHTRWATHGLINLNNTHPITKKSSAIVHNGIMENAAYWKKELNYKTKTETDTEILFALFENLLEIRKNEQAALEELCNLAEGSFAIAILKDEKSILWAKKGLSPLIVAEYENGFFVGSDIESLSYDAEIIDIKEGFGTITLEKCETYQQNLSKRIYKFEKKECKKTDKTAMEEEILEQPKIWQQIIYNDLKKCTEKEIILIGCGSAYIACCIGALWFEESGIKSKAEIASEWAYRKSNEENIEVIFVSQSGETADTISAVLKAQNYKFKTTAILNRENSTIGRKVDNIIQTEAGVEKSVASTKAFTAQLIRLYQLAYGKINSNLAKLCEEVLNIDLKEIAKILSTAKRILIIGRNLSYYAALEAALKIKEITYLNVEAYPAGELKHGYLSLVDKNCYAIILNPKSNIFHQKTFSNAQEIKTRGGKIISISENLDFEDEINIKMPAMEYSVTPILYSVIMQKLALEIAKLLGTNIDKPRNLAKSITVE